MMVFVSDDRERLRTTFNSAARRYHQARPEYPAGLYDELARLARLRPGDRLLEVGCATGKATIPLARRGFQITCVELGADLAAEARRNLAGFPRVNIVNGTFETWEPPQAGFDLVFAATAWHWIDPAVRYRRAWELLRDGGHLAFWSATHAFPAGGDRFFHELQDVYDEIGEGLPAGTRFPRRPSCPTSGPRWKRPACSRTSPCGASAGKLSTRRTSTSACWTHSPATSPWTSGNATVSTARSRRRLAGRPDGRLSRGWGAVLHVARRRGGE